MHISLLSILREKEGNFTIKYSYWDCIFRSMPPKKRSKKENQQTKRMTLIRPRLNAVKAWWALLVTMCASVNMIIHSKLDLSLVMKPHASLSNCPDSPEISLSAYPKYVGEDSVMC